MVFVSFSSSSFKRFFSSKIQTSYCYVRCCAGRAFVIIRHKTAAKTKHLELFWGPKEPALLMKWNETRKRNLDHISYGKFIRYAIDSTTCFYCVFFLSLEFRRRNVCSLFLSPFYVFYKFSQSAQHKKTQAFGLVLPLNEFVM